MSLFLACGDTMERSALLRVRSIELCHEGTVRVRLLISASGSNSGMSLTDGPCVSSGVATLPELITLRVRLY